MSPQTIELRCELCAVVMSCNHTPGSPVRYYHCPQCGRWVASCYGDELMRAGTARQARPEGGEGQASDFERVKERLARWMHRLDESDPYHVLGLPPSATDELVRSRFHELALQHHPDRGGDPAQMSRVIEAYETIRRSRRLDAPQPCGNPPSADHAASEI